MATAEIIGNDRDGNCFNIGDLVYVDTTEVINHIDGFRYEVRRCTDGTIQDVYADNLKFLEDES